MQLQIHVLTFRTMKNWKITNFYQFLKPIFKIRKIRILDLWGKMSESPMWNQFLKNH